MLDLAEDVFQADFTRALTGDIAGLEAWWSDPARGAAGLSVYRNTITKALTDALAANFPSVVAVVGADWMAAAGRLHVADHPPATPQLVDYGAAFPDWLGCFEPAADMPYLSDLARLDRMWTSAHLAADAETLAPEAFVSLALQAFETTAARLRPDVQFAGFATGVPDLWRALRGETAPSELAMSPDPQAIVIFRPDGSVVFQDLSPAELAFLTLCQQGSSLAAAAEAAMTAEPTVDLGATFAKLIAFGLFTELLPNSCENALHV